MNQEEEPPTRVTRGALRRRSIDQDTSGSATTPKKATAGKKVAVLDAIHEGKSTPISSDRNTDDESSNTGRSTRAKKDTALVSKTIQKLKEQDDKGEQRTRTTSLTEENLTMHNASFEVRRTPRRRASQDNSATPQTAPLTNKRVTRRNSISDDGTHSLPVSTPKASKSRLSVAPPTIAEDDEKEEKMDHSNAEAELSELDIRKLRNRSISNSPVPQSKGSPTSKNASMKTNEDTSPARKLMTPEATPKSSSSKQKTPSSVNKSAQKLDVPATPISADSKNAIAKSVSPKKLHKSVNFDQLSTPDRLNQSAYPKTPVPATTEKQVAYSKKEDQKATENVKSTPEMFQVDETINESPEGDNQPLQANQQTEVSSDEEEALPTRLDETVDTSLVNIVDNVREKIDIADLSMSILGTPKLTDQQKSKFFPHLRVDSSSTPIAAKPETNSPKVAAAGKADSHVSPFLSTTLDGRGDGKMELKSPNKFSQSWSQAVKGSGDGKGIDMFGVRKQQTDEQKAQELMNIAKALKANLKYSPFKKADESANEEDEDESKQSNRNEFVDDEAMEVDGEYESGDSMDSDERREMKENEIPEDGESLGSDSEDGEEDDEEDDDGEEEEEEEDDSFIVSDDDVELLEGTDDDLEMSETEGKRDTKKKRKRIISQGDSSEEEKDATEKSTDKSPKKTPSKASVQTPSKGLNSSSKTANDVSSSQIKTPPKTPKTDCAKADDESQKSSAKKNTSTNSGDATSKTPSRSSNTDSPIPKSAEKVTKQLPSTPQRNTNKDTSISLDQSPMPKTESSKPIANPCTPSANDISSTSVKAEDPITDRPKSRKSLPAPALVSADFYSSAKKNKRNTINVLANDDEDCALVEQEPEPTQKAEKRKSIGMVSNPAALALAKKNKRLSLDPVASAGKTDKRASLPGRIPEDTQLDPILNKATSSAKVAATPPKKTTAAIQEENDSDTMELDEQPSSAHSSPQVKTAAPSKKPKTLSEFDHDAILSRCNEIVRADKERKKQSATLRQKKKDEKRRQQQEKKENGDAEDGDGEVNESTELQKKKKKKKKKHINYLLEELGETKEDQVARALKRKEALLEAKRERKKAKKAAKLLTQLNKENQNEQPKEGIGAKFDKKSKKKQKLVEPEESEKQGPVIKRAISAFAVYSAQIEEVKQAHEVKKNRKQLKEKGQQLSATDEVRDALQGGSKKVSKQVNGETDNKLDKNLLKTETEESKQKTKKDKKSTDGSEDPTKMGTVSTEPKKKAAESVVETSHKHAKKHVNKPETVNTSTEEQQKAVKCSSSKAAEQTEVPKPKKHKLDQQTSAPIAVAALDDEIAALKKSLSQPITKVVKKQKLSQVDSLARNFTEVEQTPPRKGAKLRALNRLESGFVEEPVTPEQKLLKRNHGFREEPVTPKAIGFKVSSVLPAGHEALKLAATKSKKSSLQFNKIRPEDVKEPEKTLPLPIWTRSGKFEVEEVGKKTATAKGGKKFDLTESGYIPVRDGSGKCATDFLVKPIASKKDRNNAKANRVDPATVDQSVVHFKKHAIIDRNAHLRDKKSKH